jgi:hypothetical protein
MQRYFELMSYLKVLELAGCWWLMPVILAIWDGEIRRIMV